MRTRIKDFYNIERGIPQYSFQVFVNDEKEWMYPKVDGLDFAIWDTIEERDVKRKEFRKIKLNIKEQ